uniref:Thaumatin-like protein n=1 Tax=Lotharella oceanica TaxID=641309 RepID=A0A7S2X9F8_9EUKA|mmetsp:Transcript_15741/g.29899  ORF Transcript_15741/g.29899 Transcript_15741/m.29899 type:complete len:291 (+) Transcript_15741:37-909(+)
MRRVLASIIVLGMGSMGNTARLMITNGCADEVMWIAHEAGAGVGPDPQNVKLGPETTYNFTITDGLAATRYWPKMGCDDTGNQCRLGGSGGPSETCNTTLGCSPPVDSKFEATWGVSTEPCNPGAGQYSGCDYFDISLVDGFTLPYKLEVLGNTCNLTNPTIDCSKLTFSKCPVAEDLGDLGHNVSLLVNHPSTGETVGCYAPCSVLTFSNWQNPYGKHMPQDAQASPYCCPTPPVSPEQCREGVAPKTAYVDAVHKMCPHVYGYSYNDGVGLQTCPAGTVYHVTFYCPA